MRFNPNTGEFEPDSNVSGPKPPKSTNSGCSTLFIFITIFGILVYIIWPSKKNSNTYENSSVDTTATAVMNSNYVDDSTLAYADSTATLVDSFALALDSTNMQISDSTSADSSSYVEDNSFVFLRNANKSGVNFSLSCDNVTYYTQYLDFDASNKLSCENSDIYIKINSTKIEKQYRLERGKKYVLNMNEYGEGDVFLDQ